MSSCFQDKKIDSPYEKSSLGGNFVLENKEGSQWELSSTDGKLRILYFGFTYCPDICPTALQDLSHQLNKLNSRERKEITPIFISVDYKRDTPKSVSEYAHYFGKDFVGLTGSEKEIKKVVRQYGAYFEFVPLKDSKMEYTVDHTSRFYLIDKKGKLYNTYSDIKSNNQFISDIKKLL